MHLYQSNRLEHLFIGLCEVIAELLADPLAAEIVVVQNPGMARWLSQHIALQTGIAANLAFPLPATFIWDIFKQTLGELPDLQMCTLTGSKREQWLTEKIILGFKAMVSAPSVEEAYQAMQKFRFLCAVRKGPAGVEGINTLAEQVLRKAGLIDRETDWYQGKPIIIRRNQYDMQLFNGDTGILWNDQEGQLRAWFVRPDNSLYPVTPARLPDHDTAYGITIHKAQGSEFDQVLLLLPQEKSRVLSRELIYTGITRARSSLILCSDPAILATAVRQRTRRHSGLAEKLWQLL